MKNLIVIRHAKSSWETQSLDFDRPLMQRGILDANLVAAKIAKDLPETYAVLGSPAKRAKQTALIFTKQFNFSTGDIQFKEELYTFDASALENCVKSISDDYENVILFGHNEAITDFVNKFGDILIDNVSTSGLVWLTFDTAKWTAIRKGKTRKVIFPRDLKP